jgi:hypothetical protein
MHNAFLDWLSRVPIWPIGAFLLFMMTGAFFVGRWIHARATRRGHVQKNTAFDGFIVSAVLGLLALLLGFTFSLAIQRFEERRQLVIETANGIGTAYLRAQLLDTPHRERLSRLLVDYTHLQITLAGEDFPADGPLHEKNDALVTDIWAATTAALTDPKNVAYVFGVSTAINNVIDLNAERMLARTLRIPIEVYVVLLAYLVSVAGVLGYEIEKGRSTFVACFVLSLMTISLLLVIDIDRPGSGGIQESQEPMLELRSSLDQQPPAVFDRWRGAQAANQP